MIIHFHFQKENLSLKIQFFHTHQNLKIMKGKTPT